ncbi:MULTISPECIES: glycosyltransferase family 2 protein [unclassified Halomonas]|uniref:glycosyltransferase n=1 Tax=unclassified Halomonas TaxID=2609666 RepID=UPI00209DABF2|nr:MULTISPECIES: glycosyltransferase family 2 protein [unclassified Halomonas]MCP1314110.1 glycosyltransferase family 2 protein [Halomonas sp. 707D7]MCP1325139.1 glycosyltransferase family 2 protein [Halomonas sp. 707D4]
MGNAIRLGVCVPTLNAGPGWSDWLTQCETALRPGTRKLVIDSSSTDDTARLAAERGWEVVGIAREAFDHGGTRQFGLKHLDDCDVVVFLTQDALPAHVEALARLTSVFDDPSVGAAFGRQLPHPDATPIAAHARLFNYPAASRVVSKADIPRLGLKTAFLSNSFAAYRRQALLAAGGFPSGTILSEDMIAGARLLEHGYQLAYCADAQVFHSHNYSLVEEFKRYFDIGVLHHREGWLLKWLGKAEGEGGRFVRSEIRYLLRHAPWRLPEAGLRTCLKYAGYRLGKAESRLSVGFKRRLSMHKGFWNDPDEPNQGR